ncbi:hypothetical protein RQP46_003575 [Phenoliferia psychrophenolica]
MHLVSLLPALLATFAVTVQAANQTQTDVYSLKGIQSEALDAHNKLRAVKGGNPLVWNETLAAASQDWAHKCIFQDGGLSGTGSNVAASSSHSTNTTEQIGYWSDEESDYNEQSYPASHYTQMVWKATTSIGCSLIACDPLTFPNGGGTWSTSNFLSCLYYPQGNVYPNSNFQKNVEP